MCTTILVKGPCWCKGNNGRKVILREYEEKCNNVKDGGSHDEYERLYLGVIPKIEEDTCDKCPDLRREAQEREWEERKETIKETIKEDTKEAIKEATKEAIREATKEAIREAIKLPIKVVLAEFIEDAIAD
ncbi:uncharacterized protein EAF02_000747 [Botrytis sinoallii]|uniref:uncharacterized protein n=1 Tax=Botrytis sinoallii TaxID=1463999 RepID=UPI00190089CC|nr:uncharacterized protein EAF02_000747 [Botrytis sinoallii]KAF7893209.1 hypothetical protein EAF02_000747 [Botrytis sinoallii]